MDTGGLVTILLLVVAMGAMLYVGGRRKKTMQKQVEKMLDELRPGMKVKTVGGVIGRIKEIREEAPGFKTVLLESGSSKYPSYVLYDIQAVYGVVNEGGMVNAQLQSENSVKEVQVPEVKTETLLNGEPMTTDSADLNAKEYVEKRNASSKKKK